MAMAAPQVLKTTLGAEPSTRVSGTFVVVENALLALVFTAAVVLPLLEIALRTLFDTGIEGVFTLVRHLTLAVGMLGAAVAAREQRLLTLAVTPLLAGKHAGLARLVGSSVAAAISVLLAAAALEFVAIEREAGSTLVYGLPVWVAQSPLPLGFGLIALRLVWHAADSRAGQIAAAILTLAAFLLLNHLLTSPEPITAPVLARRSSPSSVAPPCFCSRIPGCRPRRSLSTTTAWSSIRRCRRSPCSPSRAICSRRARHRNA
jgi:TRAP-type C4-dicarboxylate transport system permease small subunit